MQTGEQQIRTTSRPHCYLCGKAGGIVHEKLRDFMSGSPQDWKIKKCPSAECGLLWLDPFPLEEDLPVAYQTYYTHNETPNQSGESGKLRDVLYKAYRTVSAFPGAVVGLQREKNRVESMYLEDLPPGRILDVGCGDGLFLNRMKNAGWKVEGLDFDPKAIESAEKKYGLKLHQGDLKTVGFEERSFDAVTLNHVIEHVPEPLDVFSRCEKLLKPGGRLTMATPNCESMGHREFRHYWRGLEAPRHLHIFSPRTLRTCAQRVGLSVIHARSSAVHADIIIGASYSIRDNPDHQLPPKPAPNLPRTLRAMAFQYREHLSLRKDADAGEETILVCDKK